MEKNKTLIQAVAVYLIYFLYTYFASYLSQAVTNSTLVWLGMDLLFFLFIVLLYRDKLKDDFNDIKKDYNVKKVLKLVFLGFLGIIFMNLVLSLISSLIFPNVSLDQNSESINSLATLSLFYTIFKTMIFSVVAEELLFRETLNKCINNDILLVLCSSLIYTVMNFIFTIGNISIMQVLVYFLPDLVFGFIYIKTKRNILPVMFVKFVYNLIPLAMLLMGLNS